MLADYLSCFSGIGGLEITSSNPILCEIDSNCRKILTRQFPNSRIIEDIHDVCDLSFDLITGGWPCQDISVAGRKRGLEGKNSGLFYRFIEIAKQGGAKTIVAENVTNLLRMENGAVFREVLKTIFDQGYEHIAWRTLNARSFGLPHHRNRVFIIASKSQDVAFTLFRPLPSIEQSSSPSKTAGFYWTAGTHALNYSKGYIPTLKVGSSINIPSPPAIHFDSVVRQLSCDEALRLQGFEPDLFSDLNKSAIYQMAGNAVSKPVGSFVMSGVSGNIKHQTVNFREIQSSLFFSGLDEGIPKDGYFDGKIHIPSLAKEGRKSSCLDSYIDFELSDRLSRRAAEGLLARLNKSGVSCPENLKQDLKTIVSVGKELV